MREQHSVIMRLLFVCMAFFCLTASAQTTIVVDAENEEPVLYASVFDKATGKFIGTTDGAGCLPQKIGEAKAITVQHLNYNPADIELATVTDGKIRLTPLVHSVKEVAVDKGKHDFIRLKVYVRQLTWMTDTLAKVAGAICNYYFKANKAHGTPKITILSGKALYNKDILTGKNAKMVRGVLNFDPTFEIHINGPKELKQLPKDKVKRLNIMDMGKNWGITYARFDWKNNRCSVVEDSVRFLKPLTIPFFGISVGNIFRTESYDITYGAPKLSNLTDMLYGMRLTHKKSNTSIDVYNETFVLGVDYASKEDLEKEQKNPLSEEFVVPEGFMPFNENIRRAMLNMRPLTMEERKELYDVQSISKSEQKEVPLEEIVKGIEDDE